MWTKRLVIGRIIPLGDLHPSSTQPSKLDYKLFSFIPSQRGNNVNFVRAFMPAATVAFGKFYRWYLPRFLTYHSNPSDCIFVYYNIISYQHLNDDSFLYSGNSSTLQMFWIVVISVWTYFHEFDIKSPAKVDFIFGFWVHGQTPYINWCHDPPIWRVPIFTVKTWKWHKYHMVFITDA